MAHAVRSTSERRSMRHHKSRSPAPGDEIENSAQQHRNTISTRRSSRTTPLLSLADGNSAKIIAKETAPKPAQLARSSRKRPATELDATEDTRPPTKVTVTQPHGKLLRITNGVPKTLGIAADEVPSGGSTPRPNGTSNLQVPAPSSTQDKRSLRSQDGGSRLKSDLATYFASYDDIIAGVEKPREFLDLETEIYIVDEPVKAAKTQEASTAPEASRKSASVSPSRSRKQRAHTPPRKTSCSSIPAPSQSSTSFQVLDYSAITKHLSKNGDEDPLADSVYFAQHRRHERKEKQLRNIEKERAMHEKQQLERLLDGLQGPEWLKVMGITGVTDGERKEWEPKRDYFVKEVEALVDKFRMWREQEKRVRAEKEAAQAAREDSSEVSEASEDESEPEHRKTRTNGKAPASSEPRPKRDPEPPKLRRPPRPHGYILPPAPPEPTTPFVSFYSKPHLRAAALGKHRHGRNASAFGHPIPDFEEREFELPEEYVTEQAIRGNARERRRRNRESTGAKK